MRSPAGVLASAFLSHLFPGLKPGALSERTKAGSHTGCSTAGEALPPEVPGPPAFVPLLRLPCRAGRTKAGAHSILSDEGTAQRPALLCWSWQDLWGHPDAHDLSPELHPNTRHRNWLFVWSWAGIRLLSSPLLSKDGCLTKTFSSF